MQSKEYKLACHTWHDSPTIHIFSHSEETGIRSASIPVEFIRDCKLNNWEYIYELLGHLVKPIPDHRWIIYPEGRRWEVKAGDIPVSGIYTIRAISTEGIIPYIEPEFTEGPTFKFADKAHSDIVVDESETSDSGMMAEHGQGNQLIEDLIARDKVCVLTGVHFRRCIAVRFVPAGREEVMENLVGSSAAMISASNGILLIADFHRLFSMLDFSFYYKDDALIVHWFKLCGDDTRALHRKLIPLGHIPVEDRPNPQYLKWHYAQCVMARVRGFYSGPGSKMADEETREAVENWRKSD